MSPGSHNDLVRLALILPVVGCVFGAIGGRGSLEAIDLETAFRNAIAYWPVVILAALLGACIGWQCARLGGLVVAAVAGALFIVIAGTIALLLLFTFTRCVAWLAEGGSVLRHAAFGALLGIGMAAVLFLVVWVYVRKVIGK